MGFGLVCCESGRVPLTCVASRRRSGAASPLGRRQGEVGEASHLGQISCWPNGTRSMRCMTRERNLCSKTIVYFFNLFQGKSEFIGRALAKPVVKMSHERYERPNFPPNLEWFDIYRGSDRAGELLAAFELLQVGRAQSRDGAARAVALRCTCRALAHSHSFTINFVCDCV